MKRKIICIGIVSIFLLTGLTTLSTVGTKIVDTNAGDWIKITSLNNGDTVSMPLTIETDWTTLVVSMSGGPESNPPRPPRPSGQPIVIAGNGAWYYFVAGQEDTPWADYDDICFNFSWGDGTYTGWFGPGTHPHKWHDWETSGIYKVKIKAKRVPGDYESEWSKPLIVTVVPNLDLKSVNHANSPFLKFFNNHPNLFPILQHFLKL